MGHPEIVRGGCVGRSLPAPLLAALLLHNDHPADAEAVGDHAEALGEKCLAERHSYLSTVGERVEHAVGLGFVLGIDGEREALEFGFALRAAVGRHHGRIADDVKWGKRTSFPRSVKQKTGETVMFSYIVYKSRAARDRINAKVMKDKRLAKMMNPKAMPFDAKRMIWGGFKTVVDL